MTSLNTTTGWNANKQTGSNLTPSYSQESSEGRKAESGAHHQLSRSPVTAPSASSSSTSLSPPALSPGGLGLDLSGTELSSSSNETYEREVFFKEKYDPMTGVRIASTLGGFFLMVLLTLLYKSKCKHKHSREPSTLTLHNMPYPPPIHPQHLMIAQNIQVNGGGLHDFGGGGDGGGEDASGYPMPLTLHDSPCYGYLNQVHPVNCHQSKFSTSRHEAGRLRSPAVLLTSANSESSVENLSLVFGATDHEHDEDGGACRGPWELKRARNPVVPVSVRKQMVDSCTSCHHLLHPRTHSPPLGSRGSGNERSKGNIDINVILPTPSISPSGSENFHMATGGQYYVNASHHQQQQNHHHHPNPLALFNRASGEGEGIRSERRLLVSRSLSSDAENDVSEASGVGGDASDSEAPMLPFGCATTSLFSLDNLRYVDDTSSENIPTRASDDADQDQDTRSIGSDSVFACFEHNFDHIAPTYARRVSSVSGTSSGVLVSHSGGPYPPPPPPPLAPPSQQSPPHTSELIKVTGGVVSGVTSSGLGEGDETEFRVTLTQAQAQVHQRDSFCSDLESVNDYMETGARRRSSSTQTTLSDLRHALGYSPTGGWSTGGGEAGLGGTITPGAQSLVSYPQNETPPKLAVPRRRRSLSPHNISISTPSANVATTSFSGRLLLPTNTPPLVSPNSNSTTPFNFAAVHPSTTTTTTTKPMTPGAETPTTPTNPPVTLTLFPSHPPPAPHLISPSRLVRKKSCEAVRKTLSLQCEDKAEMTSLYVGSSNETTPTN